MRFAELSIKPPPRAPRSAVSHASRRESNGDAWRGARGDVTSRDVTMRDVKRARSQTCEGINNLGLQNVSCLSNLSQNSDGELCSRTLGKGELIHEALGCKAPLKPILQLAVRDLKCPRTGPTSVTLIPGTFANLVSETSPSDLVTLGTCSTSDQQTHGSLGSASWSDSHTPQANWFWI